MNKLIIVVVPFLFVVLAGGGYFFYKNGTNTSSEISQQVSGTAEETSDDSRSVSRKIVSGTFKDLLSLGKNYSCTFESKDGLGNTTKGVVFIAEGGDKMYGDFTLIQSTGDKMASKVIRDGEYNYVWGSSMKQGIKTKIDEENDSIFAGNDSDSEKSVGINDDDNVDFDCSSWKVDNSKFVPPSDVEFVDFSLQLEKIKESQNQIPTVDCSTCNIIPAGEARQQCLSSLGCN